MTERDANQLAADVEAWVRSRVEPMGTPESRTDATVRGRAALDELVALVGTLQQERDDLAQAGDYALRQVTAWRETAEAAEAALAEAHRMQNLALRESASMRAALATTRQALAEARKALADGSMSDIGRAATAFTVIDRALSEPGCCPADGTVRLAEGAGAGGDTKEPA